MSDRGEIVEIDEVTEAAWLPAPRGGSHGASGRLCRGRNDVALATVTVILLVIASAMITRAPTPAAQLAPTAMPVPTAAPTVAQPLSTVGVPATPPIIAVKPSPTLPAGSGWIPVSAGKAPDAGILYIAAGNDQIYRYDGATGVLTAVSARSTFVRETPAGVEILGRHGSADLLRWDGTVRSSLCGEGTVVAIAPNGACAYREQDGAVAVRLPGDPKRREVLPAHWQGGVVAWDPSGTRLALLRHIPGPSFEERGHNALWVLAADGSLRELYRPPAPEAFVYGVAWSPDGRWLTASESPIISNSVAADGVSMLLIEAATGRTVRLGVARSARWSDRGELAFIRGAGRETWRDKRLVVRTPTGAERLVAVPDERFVQLAPAWAGAALAFVVGPSGGVSPDYMAGIGIGARYGVILAPDGQRTEVRCPNGPLEGLRPSADGSSYLLLCRAPGNEPRPLSVWWWRTGSASPLPLLSGFEAAAGTGGFGFYGSQPSLFRLVAWSKAMVP